MQNRTEELRKALMEAGACLVGFADLSCLDTNITKGYPFGISFALQYDLDAVNSLPHEELFQTMKAEVDKKAKKVYAIAGRFLESWGYRHTRISSGVPTDELPNLREKFPQKTIATLAGLGWIGKSTLLVSADYGPRLRLGAMLTDCPFQADSPVLHSNCNDCNFCVDACPVGAIKGSNWSRGIDRAVLLDAKLCNEHLRKGITTIGRKDVCGLCLKACPIGRG
ncbi:MAG: 4Fe-4S double cluster binding domain-containing protein [Candidatus Poribacteria bacterium]